MMAVAGTVYLVGAGPGAADLLTLRAHTLVQTADVILPDDLVSDEVLGAASPTALIVPVGKRCGQPRITQAEIHALMLLHVRQGSSVVRLKSGDPMLFGRADEEIEALNTAGIPFEIVPGISAAFAAAASLKTPLTNRSSASKLILATAHHSAGRDQPIAWEGTLPADSNLAIYMPGRDFAGLAASLIASGLSPQAGVFAVANCTSAEEHVVFTTLAELPTAQPGPAPLILLVGEAIGSRRTK